MKPYGMKPYGMKPAKVWDQETSRAREHEKLRTALAEQLYPDWNEPCDNGTCPECYGPCREDDCWSSMLPVVEGPRYGC